MNHFQNISQNVDFGPKRSKFGQKRPNMGRDKFFRTVNLNFPKKDHMNSFHTKNNQNSLNPLKDIS